MLVSVTKLGAGLYITPSSEESYSSIYVEDKGDFVSITADDKAVSIWESAFSQVPIPEDVRVTKDTYDMLFSDENMDAIFNFHQVVTTYQGEDDISAERICILVNAIRNRSNNSVKAIITRLLDLSKSTIKAIFAADDMHLCSTYLEYTM